MPLDKKELLERDAKRNIGEELLQAVRDIKAGKVGRVSTLEVSPIATARLKIGLSQSEFSKMLGVSLRTLQEWEQGRRTSSGAAKSLITIAIKKPEVIKELLAACGVAVFVSPLPFSPSRPASRIDPFGILQKEKPGPVTNAL
jgi:putative transcriptional regulator